MTFIVLRGFSFFPYIEEETVKFGRLERSKQLFCSSPSADAEVDFSYFSFQIRDRRGEEVALDFVVDLGRMVMGSIC